MNKSFDAKDILREAGVDVDRARAACAEKGPNYFAFFKGDLIVRVESLVPQLMDEITKLCIEHQTTFFFALAAKLAAPGEQLVLQGDAKSRGARVVRLCSAQTHVFELLLTH